MIWIFAAIYIVLGGAAGHAIAKIDANRDVSVVFDVRNLLCFVALILIALAAQYFFFRGAR